MTRRDYIALATALRATKPDDRVDYEQKAQWAYDCRQIANCLANDNPRFDRSRFLTACGLQ